MKTMYGLTERQMWDVARECRYENWRNLMAIVAGDMEPELTKEDIESILVYVEMLWGNSDILSFAENEIVFEAIDLYRKLKRSEAMWQNLCINPAQKM